MKRIGSCLFSTLMILSLLFMIVGCTSPTTQTTTVAPTTTKATTAETTAAPEDGPFTKYEPEIEMEWVKKIDDIDETTFNKMKEKDTLFGKETIDDNRFTQLWKDKLGINIKYAWISKGEQATSKLKLAIASGNLPDYFFVDSAQLKELAENEMIADFTDIYEQYASPLLKNMYSFGDSMNLKLCTIEGRQWGIPQMGPATDGNQFMWIRQDWLDKLGLKAPTDMDGVYELAKAFKAGNPDNPGDEGNVGISFDNSIGWPYFSAMCLCFHAYQGIWINDASGAIVYGSIQPEMKSALTFIKKCYNDGLIDPEWASKDLGKSFEQFAAGNSGIMFAPHFMPYWFTSLKENFPDAMLHGYALPSVDNERAKCIMGPGGFGGILVAKRTAEHPEAIVKMANVWVETFYGENNQYSLYWGHDDGNDNIWRISEIHILSPTQNADAIYQIEDAKKNNTLDKLFGSAKYCYETEVWHERWMIDTALYVLAYDYLPNNLMMVLSFFGPPTATQSEKGTLLNDLEKTTFTKILLGELELEAGFDDFVTQWKALGGDAITAEVNEAMK